ncbi:hypothetical protein Agub_g3965 [Astrephomene gubernaculifera]|uniref:Peroxin-5 n=1 Tax=Astrephomene gubernaculifera TaxID=47775 RepID=A0AAD3HJD0_9CHLO|nr:hypothetical protein Agub_g3965 [Astrephomene gubernaculifera]
MHTLNSRDARTGAKVRSLGYSLNIRTTKASRGNVRFVVPPLAAAASIPPGATTRSPPAAVLQHRSPQHLAPSQSRTTTPLKPTSVGSAIPSTHRPSARLSPPPATTEAAAAATASPAPPPPPPPTTTTCSTTGTVTAAALLPRRALLLALLPGYCIATSTTPAAAAAVNVESAAEQASLLAGAPQWPPLPRPAIDPSLAPDQSKYDPQDPELREAASLLRSALSAPSLAAEEAGWSRIIDTYGGLDRPWVPDLVGRAWGNRGNARSRQGRLSEALQDYNTALQLCPWAVDPLLNRGVVLEALGRFPEAAADYHEVLRVAPDDPAGWNNLGNASGGMGDWQAAVQYYSRAVQLAPNFAFAAANRAVALFQVGRQEEALREMRSLLRRYPDFSDMRAALAGALWAAGREGEAESQWARVDDPRYRDPAWLHGSRRWPPALCESLGALLRLQSLPAPSGE